jgi:hypothetical protein
MLQKVEKACRNDPLHLSFSLPLSNQVKLNNASFCSVIFCVEGFDALKILDGKNVGQFKRRLMKEFYFCKQEMQKKNFLKTLHNIMFWIFYKFLKEDKFQRIIR